MVEIPKDLSHLSEDELEDYREGIMEALNILDPDPTKAMAHPLVPQEWRELLDAIDSELLERQLLI